MADPMININKFRAWHANKDTEYFLSFINLKTQKLNKEAVCKAAVFGYSALKPKNGNPQLIGELKEFEASIIKKLEGKGLVAQSVATPIEKTSKKGETTFDQNARNNALNARRAAELEKENIDLKHEIKQLESRLEEAERVHERNRETFALMNEVWGGE
jgi:flagellar motility protein MotE (MotC chaperone)